MIPLQFFSLTFFLPSLPLLILFSSLIDRFAVLVIPVYEDPDDEKSSPFGKHPNGNDRNWVWFSSVNRVNTQVLKTVILCHVTIPPLSSLTSEFLSTPQAFVKNLQEGKLFHLREYSIRRFTPQRMRA